MPGDFRKKPVVIQAMQFDGTSRRLAEIEIWSNGAVHYTDNGVIVGTLEGEHLWASDGDWIIRGVKGEFYPCKPDIFALTYEPAAAPAADAVTPAASTAIEMHLRREWWLNHGHKGLYGDDGEMQCGRCKGGADFLRWPLETLEPLVTAARRERLNAALAIATAGASAPAEPMVSVRRDLIATAVSVIRGLARPKEEFSLGIADKLERAAAVAPERT